MLRIKSIIVRVLQLSKYIGSLGFFNTLEEVDFYVWFDGLQK